MLPKQVTDWDWESSVILATFIIAKKFSLVGKDI